MRVEIHNACPDYDSYRSARVKSLFNVETGNRFDHVADLPIENLPWKIGVIVGPSGSGKTSIGSKIFGPEAVWTPDGRWPADAPIIDAVAPGASFEAVTAALGAVGLGDVPTWLRPYPVLSNGERFRADLAKIVAEAPERVVVDEFSSVVDRQIAKVGAGAFAKSWRRTAGQAVLLSCHYDILDWVEPDWVYDTRDGSFRDAPGYRRPRLDLEIRVGGWQLWPYFKPHHYLDSAPMIAAKCYVGFIDGEPVAHLGMTTKNVNLGKRGQSIEARACRMVVLPEWQGAGVGMRMLNHVCEMQRTGDGIQPGRRMTTLFHTSHPNLAAALRRDPKWRQVSAKLLGEPKANNGKNLHRGLSDVAYGSKLAGKTNVSNGYGGHFRAVQGFRYVGVQA